MNIEYKEVNKCPLVIVDDFLDDRGIQNCWATIDSLELAELAPPHETGAAAHKPEEGAEHLQFKKKNRGLFLEELYTNRPKLCKLSNALLPKYVELSKEIHDKHPAFRFLETNDEILPISILLSYYGKGDYYEKHTDGGSISSLFYLAKDESKFTGGNLLFEEEEIVQFKHNRFVMFPSYAHHQVGIVDMSYKDTELGFGRWSVSIFQNSPA